MAENSPGFKGKLQDSCLQKEVAAALGCHGGPLEYMKKQSFCVNEQHCLELC